MIGALTLIRIGLRRAPVHRQLPSDALADLRGESVSVEPSNSDLGKMTPGHERRIVIQVRNHTDRAIELLGGSADCSCIATEDLPVEVPPRGARSLRVAVAYKGPSKTFLSSIFFCIRTTGSSRRLLPGLAATWTSPPPPSKTPVRSLLTLTQAFTIGEIPRKEN